MSFSILVEHTANGPTSILISENGNLFLKKINLKKSNVGKLINKLENGKLRVTWGPQSVPPLMRFMGLGALGLVALLRKQVLYWNTPSRVILMKYQ